MTFVLKNTVKLYAFCCKLLTNQIDYDTMNLLQMAHLSEVCRKNRESGPLVHSLQCS